MHNFGTKGKLSKRGEGASVLQSSGPPLGIEAAVLTRLCVCLPRPETGPFPVSLKTCAIDCVLGEA